MPTLAQPGPPPASSPGSSPHPVSADDISSIAFLRTRKGPATVRGWKGDRLRTPEIEGGFCRVEISGRIIRGCRVHEAFKSELEGLRD